MHCRVVLQLKGAICPVESFHFIRMDAFQQMVFPGVVAQVYQSVPVSVFEQRAKAVEQLRVGASVHVSGAIDQLVPIVVPAYVFAGIIFGRVELDGDVHFYVRSVLFVGKTCLFHFQLPGGCLDAGTQFQFGQFGSPADTRISPPETGRPPSGRRSVNGNTLSAVCRNFSPGRGSARSALRLRASGGPSRPRTAGCCTVRWHR
ncbi:hypothetical protein EVA_16552 [gut metagenome]|uniref:Uncharacterized protein n=1 Tax=gut metagenome TaxID=749906 RepID=J9FLM7_9ZZZZ